MGAFTNLFGVGRKRPISRVSVLEIFAENPSDTLTATEIIEESGVSKRGVYLILQDLVDSGLVTRVKEKGIRGTRFKLNPSDVRARTLGLMEQLLTVGGIEARIKESRGLSPEVLLEDSLIVDLGMASPARDRPRPSFEIIALSQCDLTANSICPQSYAKIPYLGEAPPGLANAFATQNSDMIPGITS